MTVIIWTVTNPPTPEPRAGARLIAAMPTLLAVVLLVFAVRWFASRWEVALGQGPRPDIAWGWLVIAFLLLLAHATCALLIWRQLLHRVGHGMPWRTAADSFVPTLLARYVPGKIWANAARLALARRAGVTLGASTGAILWETLVALTSAGVVAVAGLIGTAAAGPRRAALSLLVGTLAIWVVAALLARSSRGAALMRRLGGTVPVERPTTMIGPLVTSLVGWSFFAAAHFAVARGVATVAPGSLPLIAGAVALAWAGGYLAFVVPVGLGVRDGLLLVLLAAILTPSQAILFVAMSRLIQLAVDGSITVLWLLTRGGRSAAPPSAAPATPHPRAAAG